MTERNTEKCRFIDKRVREISRFFVALRHEFAPAVWRVSRSFIQKYLRLSTFSIKQLCKTWIDLAKCMHAIIICSSAPSSLRIEEGGIIWPRTVIIIAVYQMTAHLMTCASCGVSKSWFVQGSSSLVRKHFQTVLWNETWKFIQSHRHSEGLRTRQMGDMYVRADVRRIVGDGS